MFYFGLPFLSELFKAIGFLARTLLRGFFFNFEKISERKNRILRDFTIKAEKKALENVHYYLLPTYRWKNKNESWGKTVFPWLTSH